MEIILNNNLYHTQDQITLEGLIKELNCVNSNIAIAVNVSIIPKSCYHEFRLKDNDKVEIVMAFQGG